MEFDNKDLNEQIYKKYQELIGKSKKYVIDSYDDIVFKIDIKAEKILKELNLDLNNESGELFDKINDEKEKCLSILGVNSRLEVLRNDCFKRLLVLKEEYKILNDDAGKLKIIEDKLDELNDCIQLMDEFLDEFQNRLILFEKIDDSIYQNLLL
jgi:hypothetical protein